MTLKTIHDKEDEIPEEYRSLYTQKGEKWELTGIEGVRTAADVERVTTSLKKERDDHKATKAALSGWTGLGLEVDDVQKTLDRVPELEAAAGGKLDDAKIEEIATKRAEGILKSKLTPLERELAKTAKERDELAQAVGSFREKETRRTIHDRMRSALKASKALPEAEEDALLLGEHLLEITEEGDVVTRENGRGIPVGLDPAGLLAELQEKRPHWWPASQGGGAKGSAGGGGLGGGKNPWAAESWNMTEQGRIVREKGLDHANGIAARAGTTVGGPKPRPKATR